MWVVVLVLVLAVVLVLVVLADTAKPVIAALILMPNVGEFVITAEDADTNPNSAGRSPRMLMKLLNLLEKQKLKKIRKQKLKRRGKKKPGRKPRKKLEEAKRVQTLSTTSGSSGSEDSPIRSANQLRSDRVGFNQAKRAMHQQLEEMDLDGIKILEQQYLNVKAVGGAVGGATLEGKLSKHLTDRQHTTELCIADTGCSMTICSLSIVKTLKAEITPLKHNLQIVDASGGILKIVGTSTIFFSFTDYEQ